MEKQTEFVTHTVVTDNIKFLDDQIRALVSEEQCEAPKHGFFIDDVKVSMTKIDDGYIFANIMLKMKRISNE